jgi:hypothetical protein
LRRRKAGIENFMMMVNPTKEKRRRNDEMKFTVKVAKSE